MQFDLEGAQPVTTFASCSFTEYRDEMGGIPARSANGTPRFRLKFAPHHGKILPVMSLTFPQWKLVQASRRGLTREQFTHAYLAGLDEIGVDQIRRQADGIRAQADTLTRMLGRKVDETSPIVLLCYERLSSGPDVYCHRTLFARWWEAKTGETVPELGSVPAELAADQSVLF